MARQVDGEYIPLLWEGKPDAFFIKGHVSEHDALAELEEQEVLTTGYRDYKQPNLPWVWLRAELSHANHCYARWSMEPGPDGYNGQVLRDYKDSKPGRFKVTVFNVIGWNRVSEEEAYPKKR
jgi:hypothetical protein